MSNYRIDQCRSHCDALIIHFKGLYYNIIKATTFKGQCIVYEAIQVYLRIYICKCNIHIQKLHTKLFHAMDSHIEFHTDSN